MNITDKELTYTLTEEEYKEKLSKGWNDDDMPKPGTYKVRKAKHIVTASEQKIKITMYVDADILAFFKEKAKNPDSAPYQTQMNNALRTAMQRSKPQDEVITVSMLDNPAFISKLAEKIRNAA